MDLKKKELSTYYQITKKCALAIHLLHKKAIGVVFDTKDFLKLYVLIYDRVTNTICISLLPLQNQYPCCKAFTNSLICCISKVRLLSISDWKVFFVISQDSLNSISDLGDWHIPRKIVFDLFVDPFVIFQWIHNLTNWSISIYLSFKYVLRWLYYPRGHNFLPLE